MYNYIALSSITYATWLKDSLNGINAFVMHTPHSIPVHGCSYSIKTSEKYVAKILRIANQKNISIIGVYDENYEEVRLNDLP